MILLRPVLEYFVIVDRIPTVTVSCCKCPVFTAFSRTMPIKAAKCGGALPSTGASDTWLKPWGN